MIDIPLHVLESARSKIDSLFGHNGCCMFDVDEGHYHDPADEYGPDSIDRQAVLDVLDEAIETKRQESDAHRQKVATGS